MSDPDSFEKLNIKERIRKFSGGGNLLDTNNNNNNHKKPIVRPRNNNVERKSPTEPTSVKPAITPTVKPAPPPDKPVLAPKPSLHLSLSGPGRMRKLSPVPTKPPIPKVPPDLNRMNMDAHNVPSSLRKSPVPPPKPRSVTVDSSIPSQKATVPKQSFSVDATLPECTGNRNNDIFNEDLFKPIIPEVNIDIIEYQYSNSVEQKSPLSPCNTRVSPTPKPKPHVLLTTTNNKDSKNDTPQVSEVKPLHCDNTDDSAKLENMLCDDTANTSCSINNSNEKDETTDSPLKEVDINEDGTLLIPSVPSKGSAKKSSSVKQTRSSFNRDRYEDITMAGKTTIKNTKSSPTDVRMMTLDGIILGVDNSDSDEEDLYNKCYEHSPMFKRRSEGHNQKNDDKSGAKASVKRLSSEQSYLEAVDLSPREEKRKEKNASCSDDDYESPYEGGYPEELGDNDFADAVKPPAVPSAHSKKIVRTQSSDDYEEPEDSVAPSHVVPRVVPPRLPSDDHDYCYPDPLIIEPPKSLQTPPPLPHRDITVKQTCENVDIDDDDDDTYTDPAQFCSEAPKLNTDLPPIPAHRNTISSTPVTSVSEVPRVSSKLTLTKPAHVNMSTSSMIGSAIIAHGNMLTKPITSVSLLGELDDDDVYTDPSTCISDQPSISRKSLPPPIPAHRNTLTMLITSANDNDDADDDTYTDPASCITDIPKIVNNAVPPVPAHRSPSTTQRTSEIDNDDGDAIYTDPTSCIDDIPKANGNLAPPIPAHRNTSVSQDSSSDEDSDHDYTDVADIVPQEPPAPGSRKCRMGSIFQPAQYLPKDRIPSLIVDDVNDEYADPDVTFGPGGLCSQESEEGIYTDEPLYQVYTEIVNKDIFRQNHETDDDILEADKNDTLNFANFITGGDKPAMRMLWAELPSVRLSGTLQKIDAQERKRQEAMFEVISSEASYLKSLDVLVTHFMMNKLFLPNPNLPSNDPNEIQILDRHQYHFLFSGVSAIKAVSERFLIDLRKRQQESVMFSTISDIILDYAKNHFHSYVKYCSNQVFQDRTLQSLVTHNAPFAETLKQLESDKKCQMLSMRSFLMLPMQRVTRMPLLVDAICTKCKPGSEEFNNSDRALKAINSVVFGCNEGARKMERTEEMYFIQKTLEFKYKPIPLVSASRWLVKKGSIMCSYEEGKIRGLRTHLKSIFKGRSAFYLFLFTDLVILTKMRSEDNFKVVDYCQRSMLRAEQQENVPLRDSIKANQLLNQLRYAFTLILLENIHSKTQEYHFFVETESDITRWIEAINPPRGEIEGEAIYEEWDCPQVQVVHPYQSAQSDELSLGEGDVVSILRKLPDGWAEGLRLRDDEKGWFPINHTAEVDSKHMRAKNLMQRYRLLNATQNIVNQLSMAR